jgi:hypothetical protein
MMCCCVCQPRREGAATAVDECRTIGNCGVVTINHGVRMIKLIRDEGGKAVEVERVRSMLMTASVAREPLLV